MGFGGFKLFHEGNNFFGGMIHRIETLAFHLSSPASWGSIEDDVNEFVLTKTLTSSKGREIGNLLSVDTVEVLVILTNRHISRFAAMASKVTLDLSQSAGRN